MRAILHAKFGDRVAELAPNAETTLRTGPSPQQESSVNEFEIALTKARADWRASRGRTRTVTRCAPRMRRP